MTGDNDGTVFWHQSVELYNIARRAKKNVVMLVYNGEDHGLRVKKNQIDYHRRIQAWFGHYLKGNPRRSGLPRASRRSTGSDAAAGYPAATISSPMRCTA